MRTTVLALAATATLIVGVGGTASAAQTSSADEYIYACKLKTTGLARLVSATTKCKPTETKTWWVKRATQATTALNTQGARGETGAQGVQGERGLQGPKGDTGARGWQGWRGQTGPRGPVGPTGPKGDAGAPGKNGADGADGGVAVLKTLTLNLSGLGVAGVGTLHCSGNTSTNPATPSFSTCTAGPVSTPSPTPTLTPVPVP